MWCLELLQRRQEEVVVEESAPEKSQRQTGELLPAGSTCGRIASNEAGHFLGNEARAGKAASSGTCPNPARQVLCPEGDRYLARRETSEVLDDCRVRSSMQDQEMGIRRR